MRRSSLPDSTLRIKRVGSSQQSRGIPQHDELPKFESSYLDSHDPDSHWVVIDGDVVTARCSLWWKNTPRVPGHVSGLIGHYASTDDRSAGRLLHSVSKELADRGCTLAIGPMDQNTWRDYRFVTQTDGRSPFFMEPGGRTEWREQFEREGFTEIARYHSSFVSDLTIQSSRLARAKRRMESHGINIRTLRAGQLESELKEIYSVARVAFRNNPFYVPVTEAEFLAMYHPLRQSVPTDLILIARDEETAVGFCFAVPDLLQSNQGVPIDTIIVKTFGVLPGRKYAGLGQILLEDIHQRAISGGYRHAIHALVREQAAMCKIADRYGTTFRRYALFGKEIS